MTPQLQAESVSPFAAQLLAGPEKRGTAIGGGYALFGEHVLAVTRPGVLRMPNGIEADALLTPGEPVVVGGGQLRTATAAIRSGPLWDPRPSPRVGLSVTPRPPLSVEKLTGLGPGLTPLGDDIVIGYLAGAALVGTNPAFTAALAEHAGRRTTALSRTLLRLAARGQLPEAAHRLLENGDPGPLLAFGATSGKGIAVGLGLSGGVQRRESTRRCHKVILTLPLEQPADHFVLVIGSLFGEVPPPCVHASWRAAPDVLVIAADTSRTGRLGPGSEAQATAQRTESCGKAEARLQSTPRCW